MSHSQAQRTWRNDSSARREVSTPLREDLGPDLELQEREDGVIEISRPSPQEQTTRRCWICFEEEEEAEILRQGSESPWRHPCKCSLMAHEECLLTWVDETQKSSSQGVNSSRTIRCPQCKEAYRIRSRHSLSVSLMTFADGWITRGLLATIPIGFAKAIGITCFYYGQGAMLDVLGEERLTDVVMSLKAGDEIRYLIGASCIPFALIAARFDLFNFVLPLIPSLVCFSDTSFVQTHSPMQSSPALWVCVLPWIRNLYCMSWKKLIGPTEARWKTEAGLIKANVTEIAPGIGIREVPAPEVAEQHQEQQEAQQDQDVPAAEQVEAHDHEDDAVAERWIFVEAPKFARLLAGALLLPKLSVYAGNFLCRIPGFRNKYPHKFQRVIIGGVSFVLLKDMFSLLYLYNRAKGRSTRHILNKPNHRAK